MNKDNFSKLKLVSFGFFRVIKNIFEIEDETFQVKILEFCYSLLDIMENSEYSNPLAILFIQSGCFNALKEVFTKMSSIKDLCIKICHKFFGVDNIEFGIPMVIKEISCEIIEKPEKAKNKRKSRQKKAKTVDPSRMSVDEIIRFINNDEKKAGKNQKQKNLARSTSEESNLANLDSKDQIDKEVEEFRERIENEVIKQERLKPKITQEWLAKIKESIVCFKRNNQ